MSLRSASFLLSRRRPVPAWLALALAGLMAAPAWASGSHDDPPAPAKSGGRAPAPAASAKATSSDDAMDQLRQKLAERLGAQRSPDKGNPNVMRVASRAEGSGKASVASAGAAQAAAGTLASGGARPSVSAHAGASRATAAGAAHAPPAPGHVHDPHWDYSGENGPEAWGRMKAEFNTCSTGQRQSPIDIRGGIAVQLQPIQFDYRATGFSVIDNGHTVQVNLPAGNAISVLGRRYELVQFHFHRPSEERINGRQYDMVAHLVHKDNEGRLAVVAVLLDRGSAQPIIQAVWNSLPLEKGEELAAPVAIDLNQLLPEDRRYYTYMGSLTTPPCSEGVLWMVMKQPVQLSPEQINIFARLYPMNARPVQSASGRLIKESN